MQLKVTTEGAGVLVGVGLLDGVRVGGHVATSAVLPGAHSEGQPQGVQFQAPGLLQVPALQVTHALMDVAPVAELLVPAMHGVHAAAEVAAGAELHVPGGQVKGEMTMRRILWLP